MATTPVDKLKSLLNKDPQWERFKNTVKKYSMSADLENLMTEIATLHSTRKLRKLYRQTPNPRDIIDATLEDSSFRSRAVEILMRMMRSQRAIEKAIDAVSGYLMNNYGEYIDARTKAERDRMLRSVNQRAIQYCNELESAIEVIKVFIADLDQGGYAVKHTISGLEILYSKNSMVSSA